MFQKASSSWAAASRFVYQNQYRTLLIYSGATVAGFAVVDFTREIDTKICGDFSMRRYVHLAESLEQLHSAAFDGTIQYADILINRDKSVELYYLSAIAEKHYSAYTRHPELQDADTAKIESLVVRKNYIFAMRMCRRAMIRNGHFIKWFKAMLADEFIKYYVTPVLSFFIIRSSLQNENV